MNEKDLIAMGLTEEQAKQVMSSLDGNFVTKARFNELNEELKQSKAAVAQRDRQLEGLKNSTGDIETMKQQITDLQKANDEQKKAHNAEITQLKLDNAMENALTAAGAKNSKAVKALLDVSRVKLEDDGKLTGWDEQLQALQRSDAYLFNEKPQNQVFRGFQPGTGGDVKPGSEVDTSKMTYSEMLAFKAANPDAQVDF